MLTTRLSHSQAMPSLTLKQFYTLFTTDHHQTLRYRNMNSHPMNSKIHCKFTLKSLPQSPKQFCPFRFPDHNIMLFSFPYTLYVHQYEAPSLQCCFHLILEEQQNLQSHFKLTDPLQNIHPNSQSHLTSYPMGTRGSFRHGKVAAA